MRSSDLGKPVTRGRPLRDEVDELRDEIIRTAIEGLIPQAGRSAIARDVLRGRSVTRDREAHLRSCSRDLSAVTDWPLYLLKPRSFEPRDLDSLIAPFAFTGSSIVDFFLDEVALSSEPAAQSAYGPWRSAKAPPALNVSRLRFRLPSDTQGHEHYDPNNVDSFVIRKDIYGYFGCLMAFRVAEALGLTNWQHMAARGLVRCLPAACLHPHTRPHWEGLASTTCQALSLLPMCSSVHVDHDIVRDMVANGTPYAGARSPDPLVAYLRVRCAPDQASLNVGSGAYSGGFRLTADSFALDRLEEIDSNSLRT